MVVPQQTAVAELNEREIEILSLLAEGLSDREIAGRLVMTVNTIKWYNRQIYSVLDVSSRTQAIARAREWGLLDDEGTPASNPIRSNLPAQPTTFIGRKREIADSKQLLQTARLLTMTGSPGTGKTRLAVQVASEVLGEFDDGVYFIPLAPLADTGLLLYTIATTIGLENVGSQSLLEQLKDALHDKRMLLLLDNFEHMMSGAALLSELLTSAPHIKLLVTSREVLHLYGEQEYFVPPMSLPNPETASEFAQYEAVELFVQQARSVRPDFQLTDENALDVAKICIRLDGLPLAIELVAARIKLFSPHELLLRMGSGLESFASNRRDISSRHQTLKRTLDWSYDLLDNGEKQLFASLGVFASGWTLEAAESVCGDLRNISVLDGLASLVDKSLVRQETSDQGTTRFIMLRIIHEYAAQHLEESGRANVIREHHADYYLRFARRVSDASYSHDMAHWLNLLETEHNNLRAVLKWSLDANPEWGLLLIHALGSCWRIRGHLVEGYEWAQRLLEKGKDASPSARSKALSATSSLLACILGNYEDAKHMAAESLVLARQAGDTRARADACFAMGNALAVDDLAQARTCLEESISLFRQLDDALGLGRALNSLGEVVRAQGDYQQAVALYRESLECFHEVGNVWGENMILHNLAHITHNQGDYPRAQAMFVQALQAAVELNDKTTIATALIGLAGVNGALSQSELAARLLGAADALMEQIDAHVQPGDQPDYDRGLAAIQAQLDEATFHQLWDEGRTMTLDEAIALAIA